MRKILCILGALTALCACEKAITIDHDITAEFPAVAQLGQVSVLFSDEGSADIKITSAGLQSSLEGATETLVKNGRIIRYKALAIFDGTCTEDGLEALLEETFWAEPSLQWIYRFDSALQGEALGDCGFVNALRARGLESGGGSLFASSNVYDKISGLTASPLGFAVKVREEGL